MDNRFRNKNGDLSPYAFACGYIQWQSADGTELGRYTDGKELYRDGAVWHVKQYTDGKRVSWDGFDVLGDARNHYNSIKIKKTVV